MTAFGTANHDNGSTPFFRSWGRPDDSNQTRDVDKRAKRYELLWDLYDGTAFSDMSDWTEYKSHYGLYRQIRMIWDHVHELVEFYSTHTDAEMEKRLGAMDLKAMKIRERIATAVKTRLAILKPHKEAARRAAAMLSLPMHVALGTKLVYRTVDAMWRAAGDTSTDFNFYTKRGILAGVYGSTAMRWFNDTSTDEKPTEEFLAARIENVMQFEKLKAKAKDVLSNFPAFGDWAKPKAK